MGKNKRTRRTYQPKNHYNEKKVTSDSSFIFNSFHVSNTTTSLLITLLLLSSCAISVHGQCDPPKGSYQETCDVKGTTYFSTDPNLKDVAMCKFDMSCQKLDGKQHEHTAIYVQKSMKGCLKFFENCDGHPVVREGDNRMCVNPDDARRESKYKAEL